MTNREKLRDQIAELLPKWVELWESSHMSTDALKVNFADAILALPNLRVQAEDQSLPIYYQGEIPPSRVILVTREKTQQDMLDAGFVKVEK